MSYEIIWEEKGVYWKFKEIMTGDELLECNLSFYGDLRFDKTRYQIVDMLDVESFDVAPDTMEENTVMDLAASKTNPLLIVAVVANQLQAKGLVEIYESTTGSGAPWETEIFESIQEARAWITSKFGIAFD